MDEPLTTESARQQMLRNKYRTAIYNERCICPYCQTGKDSLRLYPDYCPHIESLKTDGEQFRCPFFLPLEGKSPNQIRQAVGLEPVKKSYGEILKTEYSTEYPAGVVRFNPSMISGNYISTSRNCGQSYSIWMKKHGEIFSRTECP